MKTFGRIINDGPRTMAEEAMLRRLGFCCTECEIGQASLVEAAKEAIGSSPSRTRDAALILADVGKPLPAEYAHIQDDRLLGCLGIAIHVLGLKADPKKNLRREKEKLETNALRAIRRACAHLVKGFMCLRCWEAAKRSHQDGRQKRMTRDLARRKGCKVKTLGLRLFDQRGTAQQDKRRRSGEEMQPVNTTPTHDQEPEELAEILEQLFERIENEAPHHSAAEAARRVGPLRALHSRLASLIELLTRRAEGRSLIR